uniref:Arrestin-like N-terminal domain-containing protein n=1 Tax=Homalodisca liturata TaxID=320908 RepID=A0A1B6J2J8_9HEMI
MGIENFQILLDNPSGIYYGGSVVSGKLKFNLDKPKKIRGVKIHFFGEANVSFRGTRSASGSDSRNKQVTFRGTEEYFSTKYYLTGSSNIASKTRSGKDVLLPLVSLGPSHDGPELATRWICAWPEHPCDPGGGQRE